MLLVQLKEELRHSVSLISMKQQQKVRPQQIPEESTKDPQQTYSSATLQQSLDVCESSSTSRSTGSVIPIGQQLPETTLSGTHETTVSVQGTEGTIVSSDAGSNVQQTIQGNFQSSVAMQTEPVDSTISTKVYSENISIPNISGNPPCEIMSAPSSARGDPQCNQPQGVTQLPCSTVPPVNNAQLSQSTPSQLYQQSMNAQQPQYDSSQIPLCMPFIGQNQMQGASMQYQALQQTLPSHVLQSLLHQSPTNTLHNASQSQTLLQTKQSLSHEIPPASASSYIPQSLPPHVLQSIIQQYSVQASNLAQGSQVSYPCSIPMMMQQVASVSMAQSNQQTPVQSLPVQQPVQQGNIQLPTNVNADCPPLLLPQNPAHNVMVNQAGNYSAQSEQLPTSPQILPGISNAEMVSHNQYTYTTTSSTQDVNASADGASLVSQPCLVSSSIETPCFTAAASCTLAGTVGSEMTPQQHPTLQHTEPAVVSVLSSVVPSISPLVTPQVDLQQTRDVTNITASDSGQVLSLYYLYFSQYDFLHVTVH